MSATVAVFKRELRSYFGTPLAYVFLVIFLVVTLYSTFYPMQGMGLGVGFFQARDASLRTMFSLFPAMFAFLGPAAAMRMWAEERRSGTVELLLTLPVTIRQAVLAKFVAGWVFLGIGLLLTTSMVWTVSWLGDPDTGPIWSGYIGAFLLAGAFLAIGSFFSALSKNQLIALLLGLVASALLILAGSPAAVRFLDSQSWAPHFLSDLVESLSVVDNYEGMQLGMIEPRAFLFPIVVMSGFVAATVVMLNETKAR
ncbi:MAG: ABC transporter permease subunit [Planctomycetes bacterium]|nr:ABC transporter permease subunit [Planctomycetota bacterium]